MSITAAPVPEHDPAVAERLTALWDTPKNVVAWLATVDQKKLGKRYIATGFVFLFLGGVEALLRRIQLIRPENHFLPPEAFNQLFTMRGTTMMFLFLQPVLSGSSFFLTPLLIGSRELAFPRLNAFSYYVFLLAGIFMYLSFLWGATPDAGWSRTRRSPVRASTPASTSISTHSGCCSSASRRPPARSTSS